jgi:hypothetical protein
MHRSKREHDSSTFRLPSTVGGIIVKPNQTMDGNVTMTKRSQRTSAIHSNYPKCKSSFVRRLVRAKDDPAKRRVRAWLSKIDDEHLLGFGLTNEDIAICRNNRAKIC